MGKQRTMFSKIGLRNFVAVLLIVALTAASGAAVSAAEEPQFDFQYADEDHTILTGYVGTLPPILQIPENVVRIDKQAFQWNRSLRKVILPSGIQEIGNGAFYYCENIEEVNFPSSLRSIGMYAFAYTALTSAILPNGLLELGSGAFSGCSFLTNAYIPDSVKSDLGACFSGCRRLTDVRLPANMEAIGETCFTSCISLTHIDLPKTVKSIGDVNWISLGCFYGCTSLTTINFPPGLEEIGSTDFGNCYRLIEMRLPASLTKIGRNAFKIYNDAPNPTDENVPPRTIYFDGTRQAWEKMATVDIGLRPEDIVICAGEAAPSPAPTSKPSSDTSASPQPSATVKPSESTYPSIKPTSSNSPLQPEPTENPGPSVKPAPTIPAASGYQSGRINDRNYCVKVAGASTKYYLRSNAGKMVRVAVPGIRAGNTQFYPILCGGTVLWPRVENGKVTCYCIFRDGKEIPVLTVQAEVSPEQTEGYQTGTVNGRPYYIKVAGASVKYYLRSSSGKMVRVAIPSVTGSDKTPYYPINYGGTVLFPVVENRKLSRYSMWNGATEIPVLAVMD